MIGSSTRITQAPSANLVTAMTTATIADSTAPMPLMANPFCQPGCFSRMWCFVIPAWERVNPVNTPMA